MKKKYIYIPNASGSSIMKTNILKLLNIKNVQIINRLIIDTNSIYYILKKITPDIIDILQKLKNLNNYLIYEPLDSEWKELNLIKYLDKMKNKFIYFDHIVCNNVNIMEKYKDVCPSLEYTVIYHEYDMRFNDARIKSCNKVYYVGSLKKTSLDNNICKEYNINIINPNPNGYDKFIKSNYTGIHIDYIKNDITYYYLHTSTKLATAMCFNSIFICNRVPVYVELLGADYEYYINDDLSNLQEIIDNAKDCISNNEKYNLYIEKIKIIRKKLWYKYVVKDYENLFAKII